VFLEEQSYWMIHGRNCEKYLLVTYISKLQIIFVMMHKPMFTAIDHEFKKHGSIFSHNVD